MNDAPIRPMITVVVPSYNRGHWVGGAIRSLLSQQTHDAFEYELIVVDNASKDNTREEVEAAIADSPIPAQYVYSEKPGDAPTRNAGIRKAKGEWIAFFDDDQFATPDWLYELLQAAGECGGRIVGGPVHLDLTDDQLDALGDLGRKTLREIDFYPTIQPYEGKDMPGTGNVLVDRKLFDEVGMFDESMAMGGSDFNFFHMAREQGVELWYAPKASIRHRIEPNRLTAEYHRWDSMSGAAMQAVEEGERQGKSRMLLYCAARVGRLGVLTLPRMLLGWVTGNRGEVFSRRIQTWRTMGYLRGTLKKALPRVFAQTAFFEGMDFRLGREVGKEGGASETDDSDTASVSPAEQNPSVAEAVR